MASLWPDLTLDRHQFLHTHSLFIHSRRYPKIRAAVVTRFWRYQEKTKRANLCTPGGLNSIILHPFTAAEHVVRRYLPWDQFLAPSHVASQSEWWPRCTIPTCAPMHDVLFRHAPISRKPLHQPRMFSLATAPEQSTIAGLLSSRGSRLTDRRTSSHAPPERVLRAERAASASSRAVYDRWVARWPVVSTECGSADICSVIFCFTSITGVCRGLSSTENR